jgi:DNA-binding response OmpR family regulator/S1-C subfamily serine protease
MKTESVKANADIEISAKDSHQSDLALDSLAVDMAVHDVERRGSAKPYGICRENLRSSGQGGGRDELRHELVILSKDPGIREVLTRMFETADYAVLAFDRSAEAIEAVRSGADLLLLDATANDTVIPEILASMRHVPAAERIPIIFLMGEQAAERAAALDLGADDVISPPWDGGELLARVRVQLVKQRAEQRLRDRVRVAEGGQKIARTAFEALAVTEKMTSDAYSLARQLKIGVAAVFAAVIVMIGAYFLFVRSARHQTKNLDAVIAQLGGDAQRRQDLVNRARELHQKQGAGLVAAQIAELQKQANDLKSRVPVAERDSTEIAILQQQLANTNARLKRIEGNANAVEHVIASAERGVCLLHLSVGFRETESGRWLRYAGLDPQGEPIRDNNDFPSVTVEGNGPEVQIDIFATGFLAGSQGRVLTNRHVAEPWWDQLGSVRLEGFQPEVSAIHAYFRGDPRAFHAQVLDISKDTDLAIIRVDLQDLRPPVLAIDSSNGAAVPGQPVILMGYATGLDAILARADEASVHEIVDASGGDVSRMLDELARRNLIRPIVTQGHIEDVLPDKILFDAQTTSGGSGGPLFNQEGKVIGVTYAVLRGFAGPSFGIPIHFSELLLSSSRP